MADLEGEESYRGHRANSGQSSPALTGFLGILVPLIHLISGIFSYFLPF
jgi:hypothetical protein